METDERRSGGAPSFWRCGTQKRDVQLRCANACLVSPSISSHSSSKLTYSVGFSDAFYIVSKFYTIMVLHF